MVVTDDSDSHNLVATDNSASCNRVVTDDSAGSQEVVTYDILTTHVSSLESWVITFVVGVVTMSSVWVVQVTRIFWVFTSPKLYHQNVRLFFKLPVLQAHSSAFSHIQYLLKGIHAHSECIQAHSILAQRHWSAFRVHSNEFNCISHSFKGITSHSFSSSNQQLNAFSHVHKTGNSQKNLAFGD